MSFLSEIIERKRQRLASIKNARPSHRLRDALVSDGVNIIAEFKRRSPSKGIIRADADLTQIVSAYEAGGAVAISVLTEEDYFSGSLDDLSAVKRLVDLPVLRKDFILDRKSVV